MILVVTGTSTDVGKTVATAALVARARARGAQRIAVVKPAQTGVGPGAPGDLAQVRQLAGPVSTVECARYPEPLAPDVAARRAGLPAVNRARVTAAVAEAATTHDVTIVEGAGGVLVRLADVGGATGPLTVLHIAAGVGPPTVVVCSPALGALNHAELTVGAIRSRGLTPAGLIIGSWPTAPDLAMSCNAEDLPRVTGVPVIGTLPAGVGVLGHDEFVDRAPSWFDPDWTPSPVLSPIARTIRRADKGVQP